MNDDHRNWTIASKNGNSGKIIMELTIDHEDINSWTEMVAQEINFYAVPIDEHMKNWTTMLKNADPNIAITQKKLTDGSVLATYDSKAFDEISVRRFIKADDGIYALAYHTRHKNRDEKTMTLWTKIVSEATLSPNPLKKRNSSETTPAKNIK